MIVIKKIVPLAVIITVLSVLLFSIAIHNKEDKKNNMNNKIDNKIDNKMQLDGSHKYIKIIKTGNPVLEKVVTSNTDMEKIISFLKSIKIEKKLHTKIKGWMYSITIVDDDKTFNIAILGDEISYAGTFYTIDRDVVNEFNSIYSELHYRENKPKVNNFPEFDFK